MELFVATRNRNKVRELTALLHETALTLLSYRDFKDLPTIIEDGATMRENAITKATVLAKHTKLLTIADDSGLEVDALGGRPGVMSARYSGLEATDRENNEKLLAELKGVPDEKRTARFRCVIALATPGELVAVVEGVCEGRIATQERGSKGFGYDPLFVKEEYTKTFAELPLDIKNRVSHRALALEKALMAIEDYLMRRHKNPQSPQGPSPGAQP